MIKKYIFLILSTVLLSAQTYKAALNQDKFLGVPASYYTINIATLGYFEGYEYFYKYFDKESLFIFEFGQDKKFTKVLYGAFKSEDDALLQMQKLPQKLIQQNRSFVTKIDKQQDLYLKYHTNETVKSTKKVEDAIIEPIPAIAKPTVVEQKVVPTSNVEVKVEPKKVEIAQNKTVEVKPIIQPKQEETKKVVKIEEQPITFFDAIDELLKTYPQIQEQNYAVKMARNAVEDAYGYFLPTVDANYQKGFVSDPYYLNSQVAGRYKKDYERTELSANLNLFNGFSDYNNLSTEKSRYQSAVYDRKTTIDKLLLDFIKAYAEFLKAKEIYFLGEDNLNEYKNYIEKMKLKKEYGMSSMSIVAKIDKKYNDVKINHIETNEKRYLDALYQLQSYIDVKKDSKIVVNSNNINIDLSSYSLEKVIDKTLETNANVLKARQEVLVEKGKLDKEYKKFLPSVDLKLSRSQSTDNFNNSYQEITNETTLSVQAKINLFNGNRDYTALKKALNSYKQAQYKVESTIKKVQYEAKSAWNEYKILEEKNKIISQNLINADKAYVAAEYDFEFAKADEETVVAAMQSLQDAESKGIQLKYDEIVAKYKLLYSMGIIQDNINNRNAN